MTLLLTAVTVPLNTLFGTIAAINITRYEFPGKVRRGGGGVLQRWLQPIATLPCRGSTARASRV
jgi:ABC-type Fe3+ transport system permease subunit